jgi:hypothetical protein
MALQLPPMATAAERLMNARAMPGWQIMPAWASRSAGFRSFSRDGRLRCHRLESPSDPPPQNYGTWCPGWVRPTPPELRNMKPGISGITAGIR